MPKCTVVIKKWKYVLIRATKVPLAIKCTFIQKANLSANLLLQHHPCGRTNIFCSCGNRFFCRTNSGKFEVSSQHVEEWGGEPVRSRWFLVAAPVAWRKPRGLWLRPRIFPSLVWAATLHCVTQRALAEHPTDAVRHTRTVCALSDRMVSGAGGCIGCGHAWQHAWSPWATELCTTHKFTEAYFTHA